MLLAKLKYWLARYDAWCEELGLKPEYKRSCCAYRTDPAHQTSEPADTTSIDA